MQLFHVYHEHMILEDHHHSKPGPSPTPKSNCYIDDGIVVDRSKSASFNDNFYLVALEKVKYEQTNTYAAVLHVWQLIMASQPPSPMKVYSPSNFLYIFCIFFVGFLWLECLFFKGKVSSYQNGEQFFQTGVEPSTAKLFLVSKKVINYFIISNYNLIICNFTLVFEIFFV